MGTGYKKGDIVKISFEAVVTEEDNLTMNNTLKPSAYLLVRDRGAGYSHAIFDGSVGYGIDVSLVKKAEEDFWPPQEDDVFKTATRTYHFIGGKFRHQSTTGTITLTKEEVRGRTGLRLVYRKF